MRPLFRRDASLHHRASGGLGAGASVAVEVMLNERGQPQARKVSPEEVGSVVPVEIPAGIAAPPKGIGKGPPASMKRPFPDAGA